MNSLVTNNNDLAALQALLQGSSQGLNLAANSAVSKYLDDYAKKLQKDNEERSSNLQKTLLESLTNGDDYKYLRDAGYGFRVDGEGITAYREVYSGEIEINGSAMKSTSYSPDLEYQYIRIETKFNPGNLSVDMLNPNNTTFSAEMVSSVKGYIDNLQKNVEVMFAQFSDKTKEVKEEYVQNEEIESYQKKLYEASKDNYLAAFQGLPGEFKEMFEGEMGGLKGYHEQGSKYNFGQGSFKGQSGDMKKVGKSMYDGASIDDTVFAGSRELKGSVSVKGIPVEVSYGMQYLIVTSGFEISNLGYNFNLKGLGTNYVDNQLSGANQKYEIYKEDISARIERQAKANDAEKESKGFIFTILNGMNGGSGSMGQRFTQAVRSEAQSRITGAVAEATGLPASLVGALVGGSSMKDAVKAYVKDETTNAISKATGLPTWLISNQMEKMNKPKEQWYQSQEFQMVTTVAAVVAAPLTGGASLMVMMAVNAGLGAATGAAGGGLKGALVGAVGGAAGAAVRSFTGGAVTVGLSYSAENGFGASVGVGYGPATVSVGVSEKGGATVDLGFTKGGFNAGLSYNSKTGSVSGNAGLEVAKGTSLGISYNEGDGFGASISKSLENGVNGSLSWSQKGGVGGSIGYEVPGDKNKSKDSLANKMQGAGGSLNFSQRDGVSVAVNASGGVNAGNWSQSGGFQANTNFLNDKWKADFVSKQNAIEELQSKGLSKEQATAILDAQAKADSKAAQNKNNQETGKSVLDGAAIEVENRKRENGGDDNHYYDKDGNMRIRVTDSNGDSYYRAATPEEAHRVQNNNDLAMASNKGGALSSLNNFLEAFDNKINGSGKFETNDQRNLRESEAHQKLVDNLAGTDKAILEKYGNRIASPEQVAAQYGKSAAAYSEQFHFLKDGDGNIVGKIVKDTAYENQTDAQFRDRTRGINSSNICSLASSAGMLMSEGYAQHTPGKKFADELAGGFVERIPADVAQKPSERITATFRENVESYSNGTKTGHSQDPNEQVRNAYTDSGKYGNNDKIKSLLDRGIPVMASTKLSSSGHITYIVGYDDSKKTWITHDPYGDKNQTNYGRQGSSAGRAVEYGQNTNGIGDRRVYWMEDKK
ncbi:C39 family peptidase [Leptospira noguchii]|uniref:C39 family peptidase n=1 Tax=Leptospira noguchii TaxID=28182 RepID=UPI003D76711F